MITCGILWQSLGCDVISDDLCVGPINEIGGGVRGRGGFNGALNADPPNFILPVFPSPSKTCELVMISDHLWQTKPGV